MLTSHSDEDTGLRVQCVIDELAGVQKTAEMSSPAGQADGVASFNYLYKRITEGVLAKLKNGEFKNPAFLAELDVQFASRYMRALNAYEKNPRCAYEQDSNCAACWRILFERRNNPQISRMQFAIAGVNAHVNFDLALALVATWKVVGPPDIAGTQYADYETINQIFRDEMSYLRRHFEDHFVREFDKSWLEMVSNHFDDMLVVISRNIAWHAGQEIRLLEKKSPEQARSKAESMDRLARLASQAILAPIDLGGVSSGRGPSAWYSEAGGPPVGWLAGTTRRVLAGASGLVNLALSLRRVVNGRRSL
jgi:hypothetical protein